MSLFWQDVRHSSKEMFVEHFLLRKNWESRLKDYILVIILMGMIVMYGRYIETPLVTCLFYQNGFRSSPRHPALVLCIWLLFSIFICVTAESASIVGCVLKKMKHKRRFRLQQQQAKKSTKQTHAA